MNNKKPVIGIPGSKPGETFGAQLTYLDFISKFGNPRILMPWEEVADIDMLILPGGMDVNPSSYGEVPRFKTTNQDVFKQFFFDNRLAAYVEKKIPIVGICLGFQMLNVFFGGSLVQHLNYHPQSPDRGMKAHKVNLVGTKTTFDVNSHHHQAVTVRTISEQFTPLALTHDDKDTHEAGGYIVEAFRHKELPIIGFQWHPEEWNDPFSKELIEELLRENINK